MSSTIKTETFDCIKNLKRKLTNNQVIALAKLIEDIGINNFSNSTLRKVLLDESSSFNRIRGAWLALKRVDGIVSKEVIGRRFEELKLWQRT